VRTRLTSAATGKLAAVLTMGSFVRGLPKGAAARMIADQASGGGDSSKVFAAAPTAPAKPPTPVPLRPPDARARLELSRTQALLYRLGSGDYNPLHADPAVSAQLGLGPRPIVHGLCTLAVASRAIVAATQGRSRPGPGSDAGSGAGAEATAEAEVVPAAAGAGESFVLGCGGDPAKLRALSGRFVAPAHPGEDLEVQLWAGGAQPRTDRHLTNQADIRGSSSSSSSSSSSRSNSGSSSSSSSGSSSGSGNSHRSGAGKVASALARKQRAARHLVHFRVVAQPRNVTVVDFGWALVEAASRCQGGEQPPKPRL
jgi:acyl dehydratase